MRRRALISGPRRTILIASFLQDEGHWRSVHEKEPSMTDEYDFEMVKRAYAEMARRAKEKDEVRRLPRGSMPVRACCRGEACAPHPSLLHGGPFRRRPVSPFRSRTRRSWTAPSRERSASVLHPARNSLSESSYVARKSRLFAASKRNYY